jgi:hypothetical protein
VDRSRLQHVASTDSDQGETWELLNSELTSRLDRQDQSGSRIDTKATVVIGLTATAAQFLATQDTHPALATVAFALYAIAFGAGVKALAVATYRELEPKALVDLYAGRPRVEVLGRLVSARANVYEINAGKYRTKAMYWWVAVATFAAGLVVSAVAIVQTGDHDQREPGRRDAASSSGPSTSGPAASGAAVVQFH